MDETDVFECVTVVKRANIYFDGKITSRTIYTSNNQKKTLGIILPGKYEIETREREVVEILSGTAKVKLPGEANWVVVNPGGTFEVPPNSVFEIEVEGEPVDYVCTYYKNGGD